MTKAEGDPDNDPAVSELEHAFGEHLRRQAAALAVLVAAATEPVALVDAPAAEVLEALATLAPVTRARPPSGFYVVRDPSDGEIDGLAAALATTWNGSTLEGTDGAWLAVLVGVDDDPAPSALVACAWVDRAVELAAPEGMFHESHRVTTRLLPIVRGSDLPSVRRMLERERELLCRERTASEDLELRTLSARIPDGVQLASVRRALGSR